MLTVVVWLAPMNHAKADGCIEARKWYAEGLALADDSKRCILYYKRAIELCPDFFEAHNKLGEVYKRRGEYELAIEEFKQAGAKLDFVDPFYNLGEIYRMQGHYEQAVDELTKAARIDPDFHPAMNQLKYVYKRLGMYDTVLYTPPPRDRAPTSIFTRITGTTLPKGAFLVDFQYDYWLQTGDLTEEMVIGELPPNIPIPFERKTGVHVWNLGIRYGWTNDFTIGLIPRFTSRTIYAENGPFGEARPQITGLSDTVLLTKYRIMKSTAFHISPYNLLSIPTGDENAKDSDNGIERISPLGSGSFYSTPGLAVTLMRDPFTFHSNISYRITNGKRVGNQFRCDLAMVFQSFHDVMSVVELNYRWRDSSERQEVLQSAFFRPESGPPFIPGPGGPIPVPRNPAGPDSTEVTIKEKAGQTLFLSTGIEYYVHKDLKAELGIQVPIMKTESAWNEKAVFHVGLMRYFF